MTALESEKKTDRIIIMKRTYISIFMECANVLAHNSRNCWMLGNFQPRHVNGIHQTSGAFSALIQKIKWLSTYTLDRAQKMKSETGGSMSTCLQDEDI